MIKKRNKKKLKKNNQKSFIFEDSSYIKDFDNSTKNKSLVSYERLTFLFLVFSILIFIFSFKIIYISMNKDKATIYQKNFYNLVKTRADILDRNGDILATNINIFSAGIRSALVKDKKNFLINLRLALPKLNINLIEKNLENKKFFYIKKRLTEYEYERLWSLGEKAIVFEKKQHRVYPHKNLFSHVLGQTDDDNYGISGFEKFFDMELKTEKLIKSNINLSLDANLQFIIRKELYNSKDDFGNKGSAALLMNIENGEILSLISLPDYDLNKRASIKDGKYTNKITKGIYELGSVFKTFTVAAALEREVIKPETVFKNLDNKIFCAGRSISEHDKLPKNLSSEEILVMSSNIGAVRIAQKVGIDYFKFFLNELGLFDSPNLELEEMGSPLNIKWGKCKLATASFGHGIAVTPLQLATAYSIVTNGGNKIIPTLVKEKETNIKNEKKVLSSKTSNQINTMLRKVVRDKEGTANFANISGYDVGGKTGTALKSENGIYGKKKLNTFVSVFPMNKPKYLLMVILDEPKPAPKYIYEFPNGYKHTGEIRNTSGWNTVVVTGKIIEKIGPILAINNLQVLNTSK